MPHKSDHRSPSTVISDIPREGGQGNGAGFEPTAASGWYVHRGFTNESTSPVPSRLPFRRRCKPKEHAKEEDDDDPGPKGRREGTVSDHVAAWVEAHAPAHAPKFGEGSISQHVATRVEAHAPKEDSFKKEAGSRNGSFNSKDGSFKRSSPHGSFRDGSFMAIVNQSSAPPLYAASAFVAQPLEPAGFPWAREETDKEEEESMEKAKHVEALGAGAVDLPPPGNIFDGFLDSARRGAGGVVASLQG